MYSYDYPHPAVSVDIVAMAIKEEQVHVLLIRRRSPPYAGRWSLPGGFVHLNESLTKTVTRVLEDKAKLHRNYLEQLYTFGDPKRDPRERVISVAYMMVLPNAEDRAGESQWYGVKSLPRLAFDHNKIVKVAQARLRAKLDYSSIGLRFLPSEFTLSQAQRVHEIVSDAPLEKRNFRKQLLAREIVKDTGKKTSGGAHRPAKLYSLSTSTAIEYW